MPFANETLPLSHQLHDGATNFFVLATVIDQDGNNLPSTPIALPHKSNGKYSTSAIAMPVSGVDRVDVTYETFTNALFTIVSPDHTIGTDVFRFEISDQVIVDKLNEIIQKLEGVTVPGAAISAKIEVKNVITGALEDLKELKGLITENKITVVVIDDDEITGKLDDGRLTGKLDC